MKEGEAWGFIEEHDEEMRSFASKRIQNTLYEGEDALHDAYISMVEGSARIDASRNLSAYIKRAVVNKNIDEIRRVSKRGNFAINEEITASPQSVEDQAIALAQLDGVMVDLAAMRPEVQACMGMRLEGYTQREIAEMLETPLGTIKTQQHRAVEQLRDGEDFT